MIQRDDNASLKDEAKSRNKKRTWSADRMMSIDSKQSLGRMSRKMSDIVISKFLNYFR